MSERMGHWEWDTSFGTYEQDHFNPELYRGFVYQIRFLLTGERYIGKKGFWRMKKTKRIGPSDWKRYTSSSEWVNNLIQEYGIECFEFKILLLCKTLGCLSYSEQNLLHKWNCLTAKDKKWGLPIFLNKHIDAIRWVPKDCDNLDKISRIHRFNAALERATEEGTEQPVYSEPTLALHCNCDVKR